MTEELGDSQGLDLIDARAVGRWLHVAAWCIALIVFEVTADPALVVLVGCSKFGWFQLRAARWLRKSDPNRTRGRACRWFYMSWGLWRISIVATLLIVVMMFLFEVIGHALGAPLKRGNVAPTQLIAALSIAFVGIVLSMLTSILGVASAWRARVRVWVGDEAIDAFRQRSWPPRGPVASRNRMSGLLFTAVPVACVGVVLPAAVLVVLLVIRLMRPFGDAATLCTVMGTTWAAIIGGAIGLLILMDAAKRRLEAASPTDCWPDHEGSPPSSNHMTFGSALR